MDEQHRRRRAISLYLQGKRPGAICKALGRSSRWFYKWLEAYDLSSAHWARSRSRDPKRLPTRTSARITSWSAPFVSGLSKPSTRRREPWRSNGSLNAWESDRCRRSGRSIGSLSGKGFWSNLLTIVAPPLTRRCNPLNPLRSISWTWWDRAIS